MKKGYDNICFDPLSTDCMQAVHPCGQLKGTPPVALQYMSVTETAESDIKLVSTDLDSEESELTFQYFDNVSPLASLPNCMSVDEIGEI